MMKKVESLPLVLILVAFLALALAYSVVVPPFEGMDESNHLEVVRFVADTGQLPVHGTPAGKVYRYRQEASQPPLYYLLSAGLTRLLGLRADDMTTFSRGNSRLTCGPGAVGLYDNRAMLYHNPNRETFPWQGSLLMLYGLRAWSILLQAVTVACTCALARLAFPQRREVALLAVAFVAFNPQFLLTASGVNNDNLVTPLTTVALCLVIRTWQKGLSAPRAIGLGILTGLAGLAKLGGWLLLPLIGLVALALIVRSKSGRGRLMLAAVLIPTIALLVGGWWFWRNWQLYQDPMALRPMLALVGGRNSPINPFFEAGLMFRSFWGQIPCSFFPPAFYTFYGALLALALGGLAWGWGRFTRTEREIVAGLAAWFLIVVIGWLRWDMTTPAPWGRLLFPALPAVGLLMALGIGGLGRGHWGRIALVLLALSAWWTVARILPAFYAPPPRYSNPTAVRPTHLLDARWDQAIRLLGYDVTLDNQRPVLDVTLYWQALAPMTEDYLMALQLVSAAEGDTTLRWNYNSWPGHGNYPTSAWRLGEVVADRYRFSLQEADWLTQAWRLQVIFYRQETGERLPLEVDSQSSDSALLLTTLRIVGKMPDCSRQAALGYSPLFGDAVALTHAQVSRQENELIVKLCWASRHPLSDDYTIFVHLYNSQGTLVGTGDGPPMAGAFPTYLWQPGDIMSDSHRLVVPSGLDLAQARIGVGLYETSGGRRLPVSMAGEKLPNGVAIIWPENIPTGTP